MGIPDGRSGLVFVVAVSEDMKADNVNLPTWVTEEGRQAIGDALERPLARSPLWRPIGVRNDQEQMLGIR